MQLRIRPFQLSDQTSARTIILEGLGSRFGHIDYTMNPDLDDIERHYVDAGHHFFVAEVDGLLVGTCALTNEAAGIGRIERMSVQAAWQGHGFARQMTNFLIDYARQMGMCQLVVETNDDWDSALQLYKTNGFVETHRHNEEVHMALRL